MSDGGEVRKMRWDTQGVKVCHGSFNWRPGGKEGANFGDTYGKKQPRKRGVIAKKYPKVGPACVADAF